MLSVPSKNPTATRVPSGEKAIGLMGVGRGTERFRVPSRPRTTAVDPPAYASRFPSGETLTSWPST